jgi:hypothetical protein
MHRKLTSEREWRHQRCLHLLPRHHKSSLPSPHLGSSQSRLTPWQTDFKTFQAPETKVRRRFTDFVFLYNTLYREYPAVAVPPLPDKHNIAYVRGDRFSTEFTQRRAHSLNRLLKRIALHPELRRSSILLQVAIIETILREPQSNLAVSRISRMARHNESPSLKRRLFIRCWRCSRRLR